MRILRDMKLNRKNKNGSWTLIGAYNTYRREGGNLDPESWNQIMKEGLKYKGLSRDKV